MSDIGKAEAMEIQLKIEKKVSEDTTYFSEAVEKLTEGLLSICQPPLEQVKNELFELTSKQEALLAQMQLENKKIRETFEDIDLNDMFAAVKVYQGKLALIRKEMINIHERTYKLKIKQKEALNKEQQREQELRREQELIGRSSSNN